MPINNPTYGSNDGGFIPNIPPYDRPKANPEEEKRDITFVLETPDDSGIEPHLSTIESVLNGGGYDILRKKEEKEEEKKESKSWVIKTPIKISKAIVDKIKPQIPPHKDYFYSRPPKKRITKIAKDLTVSSRLKTYKVISGSVIGKLLGYDESSELDSLSHNIEPLFELPDNIDQDISDKFDELNMNRFYCLKISVKYNQFREIQGEKSNARIFDLKYKLLEETNLEDVSVEIPYDGAFGGSSPIPDSEAGWQFERINGRRYGSNPDIPSYINGSGVSIAHPDTGFTYHPELDSQNIDIANQFNVLSPANSAEEPLDTNFDIGYGVPTIIWKFHGTATGSTIMSRNTPNASGIEDVHGLAPDAKIIPIRCASVVVLVTGISLARGILHAIISNADIISMSLGGIGSKYLQLALKLAVFRNIIPVAAAGNATPVVVCPAIYHETICCAGISTDNLPMNSDNAKFRSAQGCTVDISAPGAGITMADWNTDDQIPITKLSDGTSYATTLTASAAALWLQKHGKEQLINRLRTGEKLIDVFRYHLKSSATVPNNWDTMRNGAGILNVQGLLDEQGVNDHFSRSMGTFVPALLTPVYTTAMVIAKMLCPLISEQQVENFIDNTFGEGTYAMIETFGEEIEAFFLNSQEVIEDVQEAIRSHIESIIENILDELQNALETATGELRDAIENAIELVQNARDSMNIPDTRLEQFLNELLEELSNTLGSIANFISDGIESIGEALSNAYETGKEKVKDGIEKISDKLKDLNPF
jgi:subtilisin family serine protease/ElaB/YqjD/DUF883 family membrane-anchored ribosome-binding protein